MSSESLSPARTPVRLYDSLTRSTRELVPGADGRFGMYVCGPTVYGPAHIGNFLTFLRFDVLYRLLQTAGYHPFYVRNITDVDDKTIERSQAEGRSLGEFTAAWTERFQADCASLNLLPPDAEPRATDHIGEQIALIRRLEEKGHAYKASDGSVYYRVGSFPEYGKLSHFDPGMLRQQERNSAGTRNLADEYDRDTVADFALWKARKESDGPVAWESPWGSGRPGWHLECSAMSMKYLGGSFALHGGGEDLCFPHHENEIAQSEAATGRPFAQHWMHAVHLLVEGKKMSKSEGNFFILEDLTAKGFHPAAIRLALLGGHYRQQFNFTLNGLEAAASALGKMESAVEELLQRAGKARADWPAYVRPVPPPDGGAFKDAWSAIRNDLNTPAVLGALHKAFRSLRKEADAARIEASLAAAGAILYILGIELFARPEGEPPPAEIPAAIEEKAATRWEAKKGRNFAEADRLREELRQEGWQVIDHAGGYELQPTGKDA